MKPEKVTLSRDKKILVRPAHYKDVDTGSFQEVVILTPDGKREIKKEPIRDRIFIDAVYEDVSESFEVWRVSNKGENHDFSNEIDALNFHKTIKG